MNERVSPPPPVAEPAAPSGAVWRFMLAYFARFFRRHMNALRLVRRAAPPPVAHPGPLVVYSNHPAWWDAAVILLLADRLFPLRVHAAPFEARMLAKYGVFRRLGAFPVDLDARRGAAQFLTAARAVLNRPDCVMWITAQGRFSDARARPLGLKAGVAHLPEIAPDALFVPLALDYAFWEERGAEACCAFGCPITAVDLLVLPRRERLARLEAALAATLDALSADVIARDPARFETILDGRRGIGGVYDGWRRLAARLAGRRFDPAHRPDEAATERSR